jgi:hypothetical protein
MELRVLTYCVQCPNITVIAYLSTFLELDNVNDNAVERSLSLVSLRTLADIFLYLALDARDARICLLFSAPICAYYKACGRVFKMLDSLIA